MKNQRLTFFDATNISVPIAIYQTLIQDAFHFGFIKNHMANLSGLLNHLIPTMSHYRENLHNTFLNQLNGNEELTRTVEECLYKIYFNQYDFCDDSKANIPFRVNKEHYEDFLHIHDVILKKYDMNFTNYVRSLLLEYCTKRLSQREYFFHHQFMDLLKEAATYSHPCNFYINEGRISFVPLSLEILSCTGANYIVGVSENKEVAHVIPLCLIKNITIDDSRQVDISQEDIDFVLDEFTKYKEKLEGEATRCLD